ncbi:hypothetical protein GUITHDRAFT_139433 [Guillardia theta CCMP2712]|uniref:Uncharacterized protein n=1 Tax=Guillardia theta (strain CCMP2712) TaxID=905079 RepID=L1J8E4_GUITC|nr:hypothetical protein GUITHDRAFT_139433 [Guillardia theta CCMP2712]EKX44808.1 hypothetical protein GUITHDRAFT_139433 [Guillardia theta CCMP2712]|mmetsp:Transcript_40989/g.128993  ORF Transcript_40989/g.128993 Transcript_40989/m.128993 type:complete len:212 (-) Transcript_40989:120-755(-)|eukprot:XP_005831788.1 hypothetical protein GUITHDRAFT_139433 [Guillardia theta CCMP2712]
MSAAVAAAMVASASNSSSLSPSASKQHYSASNEWSDARIAAFVIVLFFLVCSSLSWMRLGHPVAMILQEIMRQREAEAVQVEQTEAFKWDHDHPLTKLAELSISDGSSDMTRVETSAPQTVEAGVKIEPIPEFSALTASSSSGADSAEGRTSRLCSIQKEVQEMDATLADIQNIKSAIQDTAVKLNIIESKLQSLQDDQGEKVEGEGAEEG